MSESIVGAIVGAVLWFVLGGFVAVVLYFSSMIAAGSFLAKDKPFAALIVSVVGWVTALAVEIIVLVQIIIQIVRLIQLISGQVV